MKRKAWKLPLVLFGTMSLVLGLVVGDAHRRAAATLERHRVDFEQKAARFRGRDHARPPSFGEPIDGNAWEHYGPALTALLAVPDELANLVPIIEGSPDIEGDPPDEHALHNLFREYAPHVAAMERGARCRKVEIPGFSFEPTGHLPAGEALRASKWIAGILSHSHRMAREAEALAAARLGLAFAQDFGRSGMPVHSLIQCVGESVTTFALQEALGSHAFNASELSGFAQTLDRLDAGRPDVADCLAGEALYVQHQLLNLPWKDFESSTVSLGSTKTQRLHPSWRCLFSKDITRARALGISIPRLKRAMELRGLPPWERIAASPPLSKDAESSGNELSDILGMSTRRFFYRDAVTLLGRVLLRVSVALARYEAEESRYPERLEDLVPRHLAKVPVCPLTGLPLRYEAGKVWSVGKNRVDDGGAADPGDVEEGGEHGDVVWVVKRRK
ncbi:MAG TPA: hypothetical protein VM222_05450 [Planctomycetota bacterium]|nr:hypothetical protein [Planctomycetota bacterium]